MEVRVSLDVPSHGCHIDLAELAEDARCYSKRELVRLIEERQEELIYEMCGLRYSRGQRYRRGSSYTKTLITGIGMIRFRVMRVIRRIDDTVRSPILEALDVKRRRYSRDVRMRLAKFASKMSYRDASTEYETATGIHVPKRTSHGFVQQISAETAVSEQDGHQGRTGHGRLHEGPGHGRARERLTRPLLFLTSLITLSFREMLILLFRLTLNKNGKTRKITPIPNSNPSIEPVYIPKFTNSTKVHSRKP